VSPTDPCRRCGRLGTVAFRLCSTCYQRERRGRPTGLWPSTVAEILGVTVRTVQRQWDAGLYGGPLTEGGHRRINVDSLAAYLAEHGTPEQRARLEDVA
jgi:hypothetical protein